MALILYFFTSRCFKLHNINEVKNLIRFLTAVPPPHFAEQSLHSVKSQAYFGTVLLAVFERM